MRVIPASLGGCVRDGGGTTSATRLDDHDSTASERECLSKRCRLSGVVLMDSLNTPVFRGEALENLTGPVRRAVIHRDHFQVERHSLQHLPDDFRHGARLVKNGNHS
jgi:hypothetical protein